MEKIIPLIILSLLILSGIGASTPYTQNQNNKNISVYTEIEHLSKPIIRSYDTNPEYLFIELNEADIGHLQPTEPILPVITKKYTFPFGTKILDVTVSFSNIETHVVNKKIAPTPAPTTVENNIQRNAVDSTESNEVYAHNQIYPSEQYSYRLHAGLDETNHVIILNLRCFPIQYQPLENTIYAAGTMQTQITYELPTSPVQFPDEYDLVIIAPQKFSAALQPLIDHKTDHGVRTILKTTESIYDEFTGRDQPEKIKYFIKDALENWNISYVLLVGGLKPRIKPIWGVEGPYLSKDEFWNVPVRYNTLLDSTGEAGCLTDLYFSDIYKIQGNTTIFDDWDSNQNDIFAEWTWDDKDILDMYPDVYVGRLACRNRFEVKLMVRKIITYETEGCDPSWFNTIVGVGGDSFNDLPPSGDDYYEGEERNQLAFDYLGEFTPVKVWASNKDTGQPVPSTQDILQAINTGCGFIYFAGHGSPFLYNTHWVHDFGWNNTPGGINIYNMLRMHNGKKLPICMVGACHNSEFNVSFLNYKNSPLEYYPTPECWSWMMTRKLGGGAIATIGYTGLEWVALFGWDNDTIPDCTQYYSGYIDSRFFHAYGVDGVDILGEACGQAITEYLDSFPGMDDKWDCKTAQQWHLLGDPSLKIGGYT